ncbi:MAG: bacillithiol biosynthesis cysteine-adding enzyme BshC [bacterium]|nr:bacillithiol biosynthesis cysteine-adding enzyme BshC [Candidatus Kapabacteria bacterium]
MSQSIPLSAFEQYPTHLASRPSLTNGHSTAASSLRSLERFDDAHRAHLVDAVLSDLHDWNAPPAAVNASQLLREAATYAVVTGQQAGIATGPLYTLYKAIGAIRAARDLQLTNPDHRFVAVFWIEGDDHDFDEARKIGVIDRSATARVIAYDDGEARPLHVGDRTIAADAFKSFVDEMRETIIETEFTPQVLSILERAYQSGDATMTSGFARTIYSLLGDVPLVVISSRNVQLKRLATDVFAREALNPEVSYAALVARTEALRVAGIITPITPKVGWLFMTHDGVRRALDVADDGYVLREVGDRFTREEIVSIAQASPERLSPNVALRPIVQDAVLPTAVYLGGPSEVAYLDQLGDAYATFGIEPPQFAARPFVLLMEPKARRVIDTAGVPLEELMREGFSAAARVVDANVEREIDEAQQNAMSGVIAAISELDAITTRIDPTLEKTLAATRTAVEKGMEDFVKRLRAALKRKSQTDIDRLESARELVLPGRHLQERMLNALYYVDKYGLERFQSALDGVESRDGVLQVIEI